MIKAKKMQSSAERLRKACHIESLEKRVLLSVNVISYHNDTSNDGVNNGEVQLTPANVKVGAFGKLFTTPLDGQVYAQPLVDSSVNITSGVNTTGSTGVHNVVFVATENDSIYAIDASVAGGAVLWKRSFLTGNSGGNQNNTLGASSISVVTSGDVGTTDISPTIGITGTPVIDATNGIMYVVAATKEVIGGSTYFVQRLHAINISNGTDTVAPYLLGTTTNGNTNNTPIYCYGTGDGAVTDPYNGTGKQVVQFNALRESQRTALSLVNNTVYVSYASHGDNGPYHGWVIAWNVSALSSSGFQLKGVFNTCPNDGEAGIWGGGGQLVFDPDASENGAFYFMTGNGTGGAPTLGANGLPTDANYNEAVVKAVLDPTTSPTNQGPNGWGIKATDFFIPYNVSSLDGADSDFGSGAPLLLPDSAGIPGHTRLMVVGGKDGRLFLLDRDNLGKYNKTSDAALNAVPNGQGDNTAPNLITGLLSSPAYYNGKVYAVSGYSGAAYAYSISSTGQMFASSQTSIGSFGYLPGGPSISANNGSNGIVWLEDRNLNELHAYDANTLNTELWNSNQSGSDAPGALDKFNVPTVANGEVYVGTSNSLVVYGLTPPAGTVPQSPVLTATALSGTSVNLTWTDPSVAPNLASGYLIEESTNGTSFTQITTAPAAATSIAIGGLNNNTKYYFRIRGFNGVGDSGYSNISNATTSSQAAAVNLASGFASAASQLALNGSAKINGSALELTDGGANEAASAFTNFGVGVANFSTQFTFQLSPNAGTADGFTFTLQNAGSNAIGSPGGGLGYGPNPGGTQTASIPNSIAIKFDLYSNSGEGADSTGLFTGGATPTNIGSIDLSSTGINLHSGDTFQVIMTYNGTTLNVVITDTNTGADAIQNYTVNIPGVIGSSTAFAGFTAGTGGSTATQNILTWTYNTATAAVSPNAPTGLGATPASATSISLSWTANSSNQTGYHLDRATSADFTQNLITETLPATPASFTDITTGLAPGSTYYYRLRAFNSAGDSGNSNQVSVTIPVAPAKPTLQSITGVTSNSISMSWQDNAGNTAQGYNILRAVNHGSFSIVATLPPTSRPAPSEYDWTDNTVTPGNYYEYHIEAYDVSGNNDFAGVNAYSLTSAPTVTATPASGAVNLSWSAPTGAVTYNVYRGTTPGGESATPIATGLTTTSYSDTNLTNGSPYYYEVTAVNANTTYTPPLPSESAPSAEVSAIPGTTISTGSLADVDFGGPGIAGSASYNSSSGVYTVSGGGADIWGTADQFNFDSTSVAGNATLTAEVTSLTATDPWAKAGLMFRDGSTANAANVTLVATPGNGVSFQWRTTPGAASNYTNVGTIPAPTPSAPVWLQLVRNGNVFTASYSTNGTTYTVIGSQTITLSNSLLAGLAVTSHNNALSTTATFANVAIPVSGGGTVSIPGTPALVANPATGAVSLSWSTVSGATTYNLYRSTTSGGEGTTPYLTGLTGTTYSDTAVTVGTPYYYTLTAVNTAGQSGQSTQVSATPTAASSSGGTLADADFGGPGIAGSASYNSSSGVYTVSGGGADIWGTADQFNFDSTSVAGNATLTAEVTSLTATDPWAKAGLMFRDGSTANAANVTLVATPGNGVSFQWRTTPGAASNYTNVGTIPAPTPSAPVWLQLVRNGNVFTASYSTNGTTYTVIGSQTITLSNSLLAGLAVTSHNNALSTTATFANVAIPVSGGGTVSIPGTPALVANPATGAVSLSWSTVSGATTYNLYRSTTSGGEGTTPYLTGLTGTTYSDTAVTVGTPYYYTLTAVNTAGQSGQSTQVSATPTAASSSGGTLADADFGGPGIAGSASYNSSSGVYTVSGGGADIWGTADQFNFDSTSVAGNATLTAEVTSLTATDPWAKAGLMFRDGSTANAANVAVVATPGNGVSFQWRVSAGGASSNTDVAGIPAPTPSTPVWLQLVRNGNIFTASYSTNGTTYTVIGSQTITLSNSLLAGLAVTSHNNALSTTATFANVAIPVSGGGTVSIPGTPTLVANPATGAVSLSWSTVSGATTYNLYRSTTSGGEGTTPYLIGLTGTTYSDTAVTAGTPYYYTLTAVNSAGQSVQSTQVSATPTASSSSGGTLADADFGSPGVAGSASYNSSTGVYTVSGGGSDIWLNNDQFNFASTTVAGNATLTAEITSLTGTDPWTKAGLMFRDGTAANSPNVTVLITPGNGISFQWRLFTGDSSASITVPGIPAPTPSAPLWLRLTRSGNVFTAYYSTNGTTYTLIGSQTAGLSNSLSAGLAVTAHNNSLLATATFANTTL